MMTGSPEELERFAASLDLSSVDCTYCDVRIEDTVKTSILYKDGELQSCDVRPSLGAFLRVYKNRKWFYCSTTALEEIPAKLRELAAQADRLGARATDDYFPKDPIQDRIRLADETAASKIPVGEKLALCEAYSKVLDVEPRAKQHHVMYRDQYKLKFFKNSKGTELSFDFNEFGMMCGYTLKENEKLFDDRFMQYADRFDALKGREEELKGEIEESARFLDAKTVQPGKYPVIMSSDVVGVFAHESFGHKSEADFMLGDENALKAWKIGTRVGSDVLSIADHGAFPGTSGYVPYDDEGMPKSKTYLIKKGILAGRLHSMRTAFELEEEPTGNGRSISFEYEPIVRMTSTYVEPGDQTLDEMIAGVKEGIYVTHFKYGTGMSTFTIAPMRSYMIRDGKVAEPVRVAVLSGSVFETLKNVEAVSKDFELKSSAIGGCGKFEQGPLPVAFGGPAMLVSGIQVS